jgi:hypothetical protein
MAGLFSLPLDTRAMPFTEERLQLAGGLAYGLYVGDAANDIPSPYGLGLGIKAGYTLDFQVYLGAESNYFFGATRQFPEYGDVEGSLQILHYGAEGGFDFGFGEHFVLRPKAGIGAARVTARARVEGVRGKVRETGLVVAAGLQALAGWDAICVVIDARYTSLSIDTHALRGIPGIDVEEGAQLDGVLFFIGGGVAF